MTGGAIGSVISQLFHLTAAERKTLLVAGAAAGMSATFATPIAAVLLAVELSALRMEAAECDTRGLGQRGRRRGAAIYPGVGPLFPVPQHAIFIGPQGLGGCVIAGLLAGGLSASSRLACMPAEDSS